MDIKCIGVTRCCRQKLLEKMFRSEDPFETIWKVALIPTVYNGRSTMQLFINNIDIGYISQKDILHIHSFIIQGVYCTVKERASGYKHYDCFLSGIVNR